MRKICPKPKYQNRHSSKSIWVRKLSFNQIDPPRASPDLIWFAKIVAQYDHVSRNQNADNFDKTCPKIFANYEPTVCEPI